VRVARIRYVAVHYQACSAPMEPGQPLELHLSLPMGSVVHAEHATAHGQEVDGHGEGGDALGSENHTHARHCCDRARCPLVSGDVPAHRLRQPVDSKPRRIRPSCPDQCRHFRVLHVSCLREAPWVGHRDHDRVARESIAHARCPALPLEKVRQVEGVARARHKRYDVRHRLLVPSLALHLDIVVRLAMDNGRPRLNDRVPVHRLPSDEAHHEGAQASISLLDVDGEGEHGDGLRVLLRVPQHRLVHHRGVVDEGLGVRIAQDAAVEGVGRHKDDHLVHVHLEALRERLQSQVPQEAGREPIWDLSEELRVDARPCRGALRLTGLRRRVSRLWRLQRQAR
jgi:hypothetical protein